MAIAPGLFDTPVVGGFADNVKHALGAMVPFPTRGSAIPMNTRSSRDIIENPMLNGEVIRLDGAIRMAPR